jgi:hypothetical protein
LGVVVAAVLRAIVLAIVLTVTVIIAVAIPLCEDEIAAWCRREVRRPQRSLGAFAGRKAQRNRNDQQAL